MTLLEAKQTLKINRLALKSYQQTINRDKELIAAGRKAKNDIIQSLSQEASKKAIIQENLNSIHNAKLNLLDTIGLPLNIDISIPTHINLIAIEHRLLGRKNLPNTIVAKKLALANNPTFQAEGYVLKILDRDLLVAKDNHRWKLDLTVSETRGGGSGLGRNAGLESLVNSRNHNEKVGLDLNIPIDDVTLKQAIINARVGLEKGKIAYNNKKRELEISITDKRQSLLSLKKQIALDNRAEKLTSKTVQNDEILYDAGRLSSFEKLTHQNDLINARQTALNHTINYILALKNFISELGATLDRWNIKIRY